MKFLNFFVNIIIPVLGIPKLAMYWQRDVTSIPLIEVPSWIDIVIVAFAEIKQDSTLDFPVNDLNILNGIQKLQSQNQTVLISIGGAANCGPKGINQDLMFGMINFNSEVWVDSTISLINKYKFDGVDIDYECRDNVLQNPDSITKSLSLLKMKSPNLFITWVAFSVFDKPSGWQDYKTSFLNVKQYLDIVFWASYNIHLDSQIANSWYANANITQFNALNYTISSVFYGYCIDNGCAYGIGPSEEQILLWAYDVKLNGGGGLFLWDIQGELNSLGGNLTVFNTFGISKKVADILHSC